MRGLLPPIQSDFCLLYIADSRATSPFHRFFRELAASRTKKFDFLGMLDSSIRYVRVPLFFSENGRCMSTQFVQVIAGGLYSCWNMSRNSNTFGMYLVSNPSFLFARSKLVYVQFEQVVTYARFAWECMRGLLPPIQSDFCLLYIADSRATSPFIVYQIWKNNFVITPESFDWLFYAAYFNIWIVTWRDDVRSCDQLGRIGNVLLEEYILRDACERMLPMTCTIDIAV